MSHLRGMLFLVALFLSVSLTAAAQPQPQTPPPQTPREALIEIITGGPAAWNRHFTVELQQKLAKSLKAEKAEKAEKDGSNGFEDNGGSYEFVVPSPFMSGIILPQKGTKTFKDGPVLLSVQEPNSSEKLEVRVESEDMHGDQEDMQISAHFFRDGQELNIPFLSGITLGMKKQDEIWRLNEIDVSVKLAIGDPKFFDDLAGLKAPSAKPVNSPASASPEKEEMPPMNVGMVVMFLGSAESAYAQRNPDAGFTCNLLDLVARAKPDDTLPVSELIDPRVASGSYNGYRFSITGCGPKPSETFHIVAEPDHTGPGTAAFCVNSTQVVRSSDDGRGSTCMSSGKVTNGAPNLTD